MVNETIMKSELKEQKILKLCYGTSEWSANSGICRNCGLKNKCGKMNSKNLGN